MLIIIYVELCFDLRIILYIRKTTQNSMALLGDFLWTVMTVIRPLLSTLICFCWSMHFYWCAFAYHPQLKHRTQQFRQLPFSLFTLIMLGLGFRMSSLYSGLGFKIYSFFNENDELLWSAWMTGENASMKMRKCGWGLIFRFLPAGFNPGPSAQSPEGGKKI